MITERLARLNNAQKMYEGLGKLKELALVEIAIRREVERLKNGGKA